MNIVVNDIAADEHSGGAFTVLKNVYQAAKEHGQQHQWHFLLADTYPEHFEETDYIHVHGYPEIKQSWGKRLAFDFWSGKKIIQSFDPDVYVSLQNTATKGLNIPQIVYLHQSLPYQTNKNFSFFKQGELKFAVLQHLVGSIFNHLLPQATLVVVQTNWMKQALLKKFPKMNVLVLPPDIGIQSETIPLANPDLTRFFYPAGNFLYKNHDLIFKAVNLLEQRGYKDFTVELTLDPKEQEKYPETNHIQFLGSLPLEQVYQKYQEQVLLFPSYIETFGLPLMEAKTYGTVILASDTDFSREILTGYPNAYLFNYQEEQALADLMEKCLTKDIHLLPVSPVSKKMTESKSSSWETFIQLILAAK